MEISFSPGTYYPYENDVVNMNLSFIVEENGFGDEELQKVIKDKKRVLIIEIIPWKEGLSQTYYENSESQITSKYFMIKEGPTDFDPILNMKFLQILNDR